jgi:hypothetical protein
MAWTAPRTYTSGEIITASILNTHLRDQLRYLKGLDGVPTIESGLTIDNTDGDERLLLPLLSTAECSTVLNAEGEVAFDETTHQMKEYDGTAVRVVLSSADVDDTPVNGADTVPVSSNWAYDFINTLTTSQDLPIASGAGTWTRLAKGTANQWLKMASDASTVGWSSITGASSKVKAESRALDAVAGDVAYTGYGFQPNALIILYKVTNYNVGIGFGDSALAEMTVYLQASGSGGTISTINGSANIIMALGSAGNVGESAVVKTLDADGFTLTWALIGLGSAGETVTFYVLAIA